MAWSPEKVVRLPCREVWLEAGLQAALESGEAARLEGPRGRRLRRLTAARVLALAFVQHFGAVGRPARVAGPAAADPRVVRVMLGARTAWLAPGWVFRREALRALRRGRFAEGWAALPWRMREALEPRPDDPVLFGLLLALEAPTRPEAARARKAGFPLRVLHWLDGRWQAFPPGAHLALKAEHALTLRLHGRAEGAPARRTVALPAGETQRLVLPWEQLLALGADAWPRGRVGLALPGRPPYVVGPHQWENVRLYGLEIWLLGFLPWRAFWRQARYLRRGARTFPHGVHFEPAYAIPWKALEPLRAV